MFKVSKEKILLVLAVLFLGLIVWMVIFNRPQPLEEWVLSQKPKIYYPVPPKDAAGDFNKLNGFSRNPFISAAEKIESRIDLSLPDITEKKYTLMGFSPAPDLSFYSQGWLKADFGKFYPYDDSAFLPAPAGRSLPPIETLNLLISELHQVPGSDNADAEDQAEDMLTMRNGGIIKGKYVSEDKEQIWFVKSGQNTVFGYNKQDITDIQRVYTPEEQYQSEIKKVSANDAYSWFRMAEWCFANKLNDKAVSALVEALRLNDHEIKFYLALADYYASKNDFDREIEIYRRALKSAVINPDKIYYRLGRACEKLRLSPEARDYYEKALVLTPNYVEALFSLAGICRRQKDYDAAQRAYERIRNFRNPDREFLEGQALLQYQMGRLKESRLSVQEALKSGDATPESLNLLGMLEVLDGNYSAASQFFLQAIYLRPGFSGGWTNLGLLYAAARMGAEAEMLFSEYADINPLDETPYIGLAYIRWLSGNPEQAEAMLKVALKIAPNSFPARYAMGQLYFYQEKYSEAQVEFQWCLSSQPFFNETLGFLGIISLYQKKYKEALKYYRAYFGQLPPEAVSVVDESNLILALVGLDSIEPAKKALGESERLKKYAPAANLAAYIDYKQRNAEEAIRKLQAALALDPLNIWAKNALQQITIASSQSIWVDDFNRPNNLVIGQGWTETEKYGVEISVAGNQCLFNGIQSLVKDGLTTLEKTVARASFIKFEARFIFDAASDIIAGIYLSGPAKDRTIFIGRRKNELIYGFSAKPDMPPVEWSGFARPVVIADDSKISIEVKGAKERPTEYQCFVDDVLSGIIQLKGNVAPVGKAQDTSYLMGIFGYGPLGKEWKMSVKNARVFEDKLK